MSQSKSRNQRYYSSVSEAQRNVVRRRTRLRIAAVTASESTVDAKKRRATAAKLRREARDRETPDQREQRCRKRQDASGRETPARREQRLRERREKRQKKCVANVINDLVIKIARSESHADKSQSSSQSTSQTSSHSSSSDRPLGQANTTATTPLSETHVHASNESTCTFETPAPARKRGGLQKLDSGRSQWRCKTSCVRAGSTYSVFTDQ